MRPIKPIHWLLFTFGVLALACNAPIGGRATPLPPPTSGGVVATVTVDMTPFEVGSTPTGDPSTTLPLPTFTPIQTRPIGTPLPGQENAPTATPTITATVTITPTPTTSGPLGFNYQIVWTTTPDANGNVIAQVTITAFGGTGQYQYYHDDILREGPVFRYLWAACRDNPGSLRVDSGNERVRINYYERPPCPPGP